MIYVESNVTYNEGFQAGLVKAQRDNDAFWLRQFSMVAMQGIVGRPNGDFESVQEIASHSVIYATALLDEIKRREQENDKQ